MGRNQWIKRLAVVSLLLVGLGGLSWWRLDDSKVSHPEGSANPSFASDGVIPLPKHQRPPMDPLNFTDARGRALTVQHFTGQVVLVNLWATWCPPCVAEMGDLDQLQQRWNQSPFHIVAISVDRGGIAQAKRWLDSQGLQALPVYHAPPTTVAGGVLPTSYLLDRQGRVAWMGVGMQDWLGPETQQTLTRLLAE